MPALRQNQVSDTSTPETPSDTISGGAVDNPGQELSAAVKQIRTEHRAYADATFRSLVIACGLAILAIVGLILFELITQSHLSLRQFGLKFLARSIWDPNIDDYGALPFIYGTLVSSFLGLLIAVPLSVGTALFLTEICPRQIRAVLSLCVELLAAIPSVIYGLWGIFVLVPFLRLHLEPFLQHYFLWTGLFSGPKIGFGMLAAGIIIAIMILPIICSISREVIVAVPRQQREAALALGATKWEMLRIAVLRNARPGIFGAIILGLGRAFGETMAVTMVIGNRPEIARSLFAAGDTLASSIANQFNEATTPMYQSALVEMGLVLFVLTLLVNALAGLLVWSITRGQPARGLA
ncbi:MAG TPA: phosphate ABC transporter permease subunit PstC [Candidatus Angelobacter sp.]|jgi:phosphate transport system permease protein|nr:phosphate ABC transporter permease subunit PstC [Candidatus Angelobacter sp.]